MPPLPWTTIAPVPASGEVVVLASRLQLHHFREIPAFLRRALRRTEGVPPVEGRPLACARVGGPLISPS